MSVGSFLPSGLVATGVSFDFGELWIAILIIGVVVLTLSLYLTYRLAKHFDSPWIWFIWVAGFLFAVNTFFFTNW